MSSRHDAETSRLRVVLFQWLPCLLYVALYVVLDILIASEGETDELTGRRKYEYIPGALILLAEGGKLVLSVTALVWEHHTAVQNERRKRSSSTEDSFSSYEDEDLDVARLRRQRTSSAGVDESEPKASGKGKDLIEVHRVQLDWLGRGVWYLVPAILYTSWNYLNYQSILHVPLSVYSIIYQSVLFFTALLWSVTFNKKLTVTQWMALLLLAGGVFLIHLKSDFEFSFDIAIVWVLSQAMVSAVASVYNEFLYKRPSEVKISINEQNTYLYTWTSVCTALYLLGSEGPEFFETKNFFKGFTPTVWVIVFVTIFLGISVAMILKHMNVIVKLYAQAIHSPVEVIAAHFILKTDLTWMIALASALIGVSTVLYYRPQDTKPKSALAKQAEDYEIDPETVRDEETVALTTGHPTIWESKARARW